MGLFASTPVSNSILFDIWGVEDGKIKANGDIRIFSTKEDLTKIQNLYFTVNNIYDFDYIPRQSIKI